MRLSPGVTWRRCSANRSEAMPCTASMIIYACVLAQLDQRISEIRNSNTLARQNSEAHHVA
jgi:hypothetical protein